MTGGMHGTLRRCATVTIAALALCSGAAVAAPGSTNDAPVYDRLADAASCRASSDGAVWYTLTAGVFSPLHVAASDCPAGALGIAPAPVPSWAKPNGPTQAVFSAVSLVEKPRGGPIGPIAATAHAAGVPLTYLLGWDWIPSNVPIIDAEHARGDDVQVVPSNLALARDAWSWFAPAISVLGAGMERRIDLTVAAKLGAFWGITWDSSGVDGAFDRGTPWGLYCADPRSYKRPATDGRCDLAGIEWTARDLTMTYESGHEDAYSTDPDDLRLRAGLAPPAAAEYEREMVDAYAAAGQTTPLLMVAQEEAWEFSAALAQDRPIELALYEQARRDGMTVTTLANAVSRLAPTAAQPRVVAFPSLAVSGRYGPATIDAHDAHVGLTFTAANLMPDRVFAYDRATTSSRTVPIPQLSAREMPELLGVAAHDGVLTLRIRAPVATDFGVAFWVDPAVAGWTSPNVIPAGRAGAVAFFDLVRGDNTIALGCRACTSMPFPYAGT
jgi:hypothetical protein